MLEPLVVLDLFNEWRALPNAAWASGLPGSEAGTESLLQQLAVPLIPEHVAGLVRTELVRAMNALGSLSFTHPTAAPPPGVALGAAGWRTAVVAEAARLASNGAALAALPGLDAATIGARYDALLAGCQSVQFFAAREYLSDMGGKELLAALAQHLNGLGAPGRLNSTAIADALLHALVRIYQPNTLFQPDDFAELGAILAQF
ncbi:hypothetical protein R5W23_001521 [Gemmata sp. JC673]|uniref:Uncharacterized protein n=1 Tax=Gemmata algarum TaxID=2975278 RepID=A0ABU5F0A9_9BACT|nr:hypothetical protein [Gemmata algarum]MDY3560292.1 hypothetical protein [Gemmata algarum]